jgi:LCP family protein required for cell wall assembly
VSEPGPRAGSHRGPILRRIAAVVSVLALVATAASAVGWRAVTDLAGNITTLDVTADLGTDRPTVVTPQQPQEYDPVNILIMGTDTRTGQGGGFGNPSKTASGRGHSDTTILLHVSGDRSRALALSIPRDTWVTRPACKGGGTTEGKFNEAFSLGGPACTIKAVESLTDVRIDHFVVVDFKGFIGVVDALDGIPICLKEAVNDKDSKLKLSKGNHVLDGEQALAFARTRKTLGDGSDISRINRQQVFLSAVVRKATEKNVLTDLPTLYNVLDATTKSLTTDPDLGSVDKLKDLALSMQGLSPAKVQFVTVPWVSRGDGENVLVYEPKADPIFKAMRNDTAWPPKSTTPEGQKPLSTPPSDIQVKVLNGSGSAGLGAQAAAALEKQGFVVTSVGNAKSSDYAQTTVVYDPGFDESARTLTYASKAAVSKATGSGRTLTLIVGSDWSGARKVTIAGGGSSGSASDPAPTSADTESCVG